MGASRRTGLPGCRCRCCLLAAPSGPDMHAGRACMARHTHLDCAPVIELERFGEAKGEQEVAQPTEPNSCAPGKLLRRMWADT